MKIEGKVIGVKEKWMNFKCEYGRLIEIKCGSYTTFEIELTEHEAKPYTIGRFVTLDLTPDRQRKP